eukprot:3188317-Prymnesium_polylepis.1
MAQARSAGRATGALATRSVSCGAGGGWQDARHRSRRPCRWACGRLASAPRTCADAGRNAPRPTPGR